jgi:hypothetical protein
MLEAQAANYAARSLAEAMCKGAFNQDPSTAQAHNIHHLAEMAAEDRCHPMFDNELVMERQLRTDACKLCKCGA